MSAVVHIIDDDTEVLAALDSRPAGLTAEEADQRLERFGPNRLAPPGQMPWWRRVLAQFDDTLIYILLVAAAFKAILGDWVDFSVILGVAVPLGASWAM